MDAAGRQDAHRLAGVARDCEVAGIARRCLLLRLSILPHDLRKPHHLRLMCDALDPLLSADRAQRFVLPNDDIAVVWRGAAEAMLAASRHAIARMFADAGSAMPAPETLWQPFDLPSDAQALQRLVADSLSDGPLSDGPVREVRPGEPLDAPALAALETALTQANVARFARRRIVCSAGTEGRFQPGWEARYLAAEDICAELADGRGAHGEPWLYRRLARTLERRLLALVAANQELRTAGPFGLDLGVTSVLGADFLRFDAALPMSLRGQITLAFEPADILADLSAFRFARDFAHGRGYRLVLRLADCVLLPVVPVERLGLDLVEIVWSRAAMALPPDLLDREAGRTILSGADTAEAVAWGWAHGIAWFEGLAVTPGQPVVGDSRDRIVKRGNRRQWASAM
jgi:hypothetical protein